jgi:exodeoxyribonuclease VII large subunit
MQQNRQSIYIQFKTVEQRLQLVTPLPLIKQKRINLQQLQKQLHTTMQQVLFQQKNKLNQQMRTLAAVSPLSTLERGYSITTKIDSDEVLQNATRVELGQRINVRLQQGQLNCEVKEINND